MAICPAGPDLRSSELWEHGYRQALQDAGIAFDPALVRVGGYDPDTAAAPARDLLTLANRPTAIFAANDLSAIQTMNVAAEVGLTVPDDLSVIRFDNAPESVLAEPSQTTIDHSIQEQGYEAVGTSSANLVSAGHVLVKTTGPMEKSFDGTRTID